MIKAAVAGFTGRLGQAVLPSLLGDSAIQVTAGISRSGQADKPGLSAFPVFKFPAEAFERVPFDVLLDVSHRIGARERYLAAIGLGADVVTGVTGIEAEVLNEVAAAALTSGRRFLIVPNFAIGAVLMMRFAEAAAKWMPDFEIIELHHAKKEDAPSGTAMMTLARMAAARASDPTAPDTKLEKLKGARGGEQHRVHVHSVRLPGLTAHQEVIFGAPGEGLTIRHDAYDRACCGPGAALCVREVAKLAPGLHQGMDCLLFPGEGEVNC